MRLGKWRFTPNLWPSLAFVLVLALLLRLGFWQLQRAEEKQALQTEYQSRMAAEPVRLAEAAGRRERMAEMLWRRCVLSGEYDPDTVYLLDNQVFRGQPGYHVFARFLLEDGAAVLVNRGWVPAPARRSEAPEVATPRGAVTLTGVAAPLPATGLPLGGHVAERLSDKFTRVARIDLEEIAADNGWTLLPYIARLDAPGPAGMSRVWRAPGFGKEKHQGYAFQWFLMAFALTVIYIVVNAKRQGDDNRGRQ